MSASGLSLCCLTVKRPTAVAVFALGAALIAAAGCDGSLEVEPPARTVRVVLGSVELVGSGLGSCSHGLTPEGAASSARWCAFARPGPAAGTTELWAVNVSRALAAERAVSCDGSSPHCVLLTSNLWDDQPLFQVGHPYIHGFTGDTLSFYADARNKDPEDGYAGPVRAWRPGMSAPRTVTDESGFSCSGHLRSDGVLCLARQTGFGISLEFDLLVGTLGEGSGPLPLLRRVKPYGMRRTPIWQVGFSPGGEHLLLSSQAPGIAVERLELVGTREVGMAEPRELTRNMSRWEVSPDGQKIFFLAGFVPTADGGSGMGTLTMADFPTMGNPVELAARVAAYELYPRGDRRAPVRSVSLLTDIKDGLGTFRVIGDITRPAESVTVAQEVRDPLVSPDLRYSVFDGVTSNNDIVTYLAHNGGAGQCALTDPGASAFGVTFAGATRQVFWLQDAPGNTGKFDAWMADPEGCGGRRLFSDRMALMRATRKGLVHGVEEQSPATMSVYYTALHQPAAQPQLLAGQVQPQVVLLDQRYLIFTIDAEPDKDGGLYIHGPMP